MLLVPSPALSAGGCLWKAEVQATLKEAPLEEFSDTGLTCSTEDVAVRSAADARKLRAVNEIIVHIFLHIPNKV